MYVNKTGTSFSYGSDGFVTPGHFDYFMALGQDKKTGLPLFVPKDGKKLIRDYNMKYWLVDEDEVKKASEYDAKKF